MANRNKERFLPVREKMDGYAKSLRMLNQSQYILLINKYIHMSIDDLTECANNRDLPTLDHIIIRILEKAMREGDVNRLESLIGRVIGKSNIRPKEIIVDDPDDMTELEKKQSIEIEFI